MTLDLEIEWSANGSKPRSSGKPKGIKSAAQARLDRITNPTPVLYTAFLRWRGKLRDTATYPTPELRERAEELRAMIAAAEQQLASPPATWRSPEWERTHDAKQRLAGQLWAIESALIERKQNPHAGRGCRQVRGNQVTGRDPFAWE